MRFNLHQYRSFCLSLHRLSPKLTLLRHLLWKSDKRMDGRVLHKKHIVVLEVRLKLYFPRTEFMRLVMILVVTLVTVFGTNRSAFVMDLTLR